MTASVAVANLTVLIPEAEIARRRRDLAAEISRRHAGEDLLMVCVLKGSMPFFVDLSREVSVPVRYDCIGVSSYGDGTTSSGEPKLVSDLAEPIAGRRVLLVEDIVDTGRTLAFLRRLLEARAPRSLEVVTLLDKPERRRVPVVVDYVGFTIPDRFVVGYGLDLAQRYRNLPFIGVLGESDADAAVPREPVATESR